MKAQHFVVFYKIVSSKVCRVEHRDTEADVLKLKPQLGERMLMISYANKTNVQNIVASLGLIWT